HKEEVKIESDIERSDESQDDADVYTCAYAINPANNEKVPVWIADYVMMSYVSGAILAVPGHDERDYEFATKFDLPIKEVVQGGDLINEAYTGDGDHINSSFLDGLHNEEAITKMIDWLVDHKVGKRQITYRLRDWLFSRQR